MALTDPPLPDPPVDGDPVPFWTIMEQAPPDEPQEPSDPPPPLSTVQSQSSDPSEPDDLPAEPDDLPAGTVRAGGAIVPLSELPGAEDSAGGAGGGASNVDSTPAGSFDDVDLIDFGPLVAYASGFGPAPAPGSAAAGSSPNDLSEMAGFRGSISALGGLQEPAGQDSQDYLPPWIGMDGPTDSGGLPAWLGLDQTPAPLDLELLEANGVPVEWDFSLQGRFTDWSLL